MEDWLFSSHLSFLRPTDEPPLGPPQARGTFARARAATPEALVAALDPAGLLRAAEPLLTSYEEDEARLSAASAISAPLLEQLQEAGGVQALLADEQARGRGLSSSLETSSRSSLAT